MFMDSQLYSILYNLIQQKLALLPDKPEETAKATLHVLWCLAGGIQLSVEAADGYPLPDLDSAQQEILANLVEQRLSGKPLAHLSGRQRFMSLELLAGSQALIPRKETEILGKTGIMLLEKVSANVTAPRVIDVCTGAGNLALVMAVSCPTCSVFASDLSSEAVELARKNARHLNVANRMDVIEGDLFAAFSSSDFYESIDLITCNPPYISSAKVPEMNSEISEHEPAMAFDGGPFGIKILHRVIKEAPRFLKQGGWLAFEVGAGQGAAMVKRMEKKYAYTEVSAVEDDEGVIRAVFGRHG
jgi:release factor glutamine methyltransferase